MVGRYQRAVDLLELIRLLQKTTTGVSIHEIAAKFEVSRRTAERMLGALQSRFPELKPEYRKGRKYWRFVHTNPVSENSPWIAEGFDPSQDLAGAIAHSIRGPLTGILLGARSVLDGEEDDVTKAVERIEDLAKQMNHIMERTLSLVRRDELTLELSCPSALLEAAAREVAPEAEKAGVEIELEADRNLPYVEGDRLLLTSALVDLARNSIEAMPHGGRLKLHAESVASGSSVRLAATDTGPGVSVKDAEWIFEPFFTTKEDGTGLGLAIARQIARAHGGGIAVGPAGPAGPGATIHIDVPLHPVPGHPGKGPSA